MAEIIITGFHAIEERIRRAENSNGLASTMRILYSKPGPRIKKILSQAKTIGISQTQVDDSELDSLASHLPEIARDHRGIVMCVKENHTKPQNIIDFDQWLASIQNQESPDEKRITVMILDSVTDPHNVGAIIRSADQFACSLVILPSRNSANDIEGNDIIARSSAGASAWVPVSIVTNLVRTLQQLKESGFWTYGADAGGETVQTCKFPKRTAIVMGSEGTGISRLLKSECDSIVSIPTNGRIDSLNVSVAAGVLLYEVYRQSLN
jgi:23S rRNA (guanosine2251-2'-O)-methyltransferase